MPERAVDLSAQPEALVKLSLLMADVAAVVTRVAPQVPFDEGLALRAVRDVQPPLDDAGTSEHPTRG